LSFQTKSVGKGSVRTVTLSDSPQLNAAAVFSAAQRTEVRIAIVATCEPRSERTNNSPYSACS
jgi:hypothetical protein